jgi:hypothetical protein
MRRHLYLWHRYLGIALCLLFALWFVSGVVMMYVRMPILFPQERFQFLEPFDPAAVALAPDEALERSGVQNLRRVRLASLSGRPVYYILRAGERWSGVYADDGAPVEEVTSAAARAIVARFYPGATPQVIRTVEEIDQWTLTNSLNLHRPLHRIAIGDAAGTQVYVSSHTGEIVMRTTSRERALAWLGPIIHWGAPELLRTRVGLWRNSMLWISFAGVVLTITGIWIGLMRYRRRGYRLRQGPSSSPYVGWKRWHHYGGLAFGLVTLTWMVSGWLYLNPGGSRSGPLSTVTTMSPYNVGGVRADNSAVTAHGLALAGGPFDRTLYTRGPAEVWRRMAGGGAGQAAFVAAPAREEAAPQRGRYDFPREIELTRVGGEPFYVFYADWDRSWLVPASPGAPWDVQEHFGERRLTELAARMIPGARLTEARFVHEYDAYYYSVGAVAPKRLPVFLAKFDDPDHTWYYINAHTGTVFRRYDTHGRVMRWLVNGLHTLDFPLLFANRPAWDLAIIILSAGGLALSLTGVVLGWRRVTDRPRRQEEPREASRRIA